MIYRVLVLAKDVQDFLNWCKIHRAIRIDHIYKIGELQDGSQCFYAHDVEHIMCLAIHEVTETARFPYRSDAEDLRHWALVRKRVPE